MIKTFATETVLTVYTNIMFGNDMTDIHECYEHVIGCPFPSILIANEKVIRTCAYRILEQVPDIAQAGDILKKHQAVSLDNIKYIKTDLYDLLGPQIALNKGSGELDSSN